MTVDIGPASNGSRSLASARWAPGIAQVCAQAGLEVVALDVDAERLEAGRERMARFLAGGVERGKVTPEERDAALERVRGVREPSDLAGADVVIEAVVEDLELKRDAAARRRAPSSGSRR